MSSEQKREIVNLNVTTEGKRSFQSIEEAIGAVFPLREAEGKVEIFLALGLPKYNGLKIIIEKKFPVGERLLLKCGERMGRSTTKTKGHHSVGGYGDMFYSPEPYLVIEGTEDRYELLDRGLCWVHPTDTDSDPILDVRLHLKVEKFMATKDQVVEVANNARSKAQKVIEDILSENTK